jgi:hypothetical protein
MGLRREIPGARNAGERSSTDSVAPFGSSRSWVPLHPGLRRTPLSGTAAFGG